MNSHELPPIWRTITSLGVFLLYALVLAVPSGYAYGGGLLFIAGLAFVADHRPRGLSCEDKTLLLTLLAVFTVALAMFGYHGNPLNSMDGSSRCLLLIPALILLLQAPPSLPALWSGVAIGAISAVPVALWQRYVQGEPRPSGFLTSAIPFGDVSVLVSLLCLAGMVWAGTQGGRALYWRIALGIGFLAGLYASLLSGSRGGWIAIPPVLILLGVATLRRTRLKHALYAIVLAAAGIALAAGLTHKQIALRYQLAVQEITNYYTGVRIDTSIGMRLEAWRVAAISIAEHPLLGWSYDDYEKHVDQLTSSRRADASIKVLANTHNNYIEAWLHQGLPGLLALLALFLIPFWMFCKRLRSPDKATQALALAGATLQMSFAVFALTEVILGRVSEMSLYLLSVIVLWACLRAKPRLAQE